MCFTISYSYQSRRNRISCSHFYQDPLVLIVFVIWEWYTQGLSRDVRLCLLGDGWWLGVSKCVCVRNHWLLSLAHSQLSVGIPWQPWRSFKQTLVQKSSHSGMSRTACGFSKPIVSSQFHQPIRLINHNSFKNSQKPWSCDWWSAEFLRSHY